MKIIGLLALPGDAQAACLSKWGVAPLTDELALELSDHVRMLDQFTSNGYLREKDAAALREIDALFATMSGPENAPLWTVEALMTRTEWEEVRERARSFLCSV